MDGSDQSDPSRGTDICLVEMETDCLEADVNLYVTSLFVDWKSFKKMEKV